MLLGIMNVSRTENSEASRSSTKTPINLNALTSAVMPSPSPNSSMTPTPTPSTTAPSTSVLSRPTAITTDVPLGGAEIASTTYIRSVGTGAGAVSVSIEDARVVENGSTPNMAPSNKGGDNDVVNGLQGDTVYDSEQLVLASFPWEAV